MNEEPLPEINQSLLDDAEFVKLIEQEALELGLSEDALSQQRVWNRLQISVKNRLQTKIKSKRNLLYWSAAAGLVIGLSASVIQYNGEDQFKSGGVIQQAIQGLQVTQQRDGLHIELILSDQKDMAFALVADQSPPQILWQGLGATWPGSLIVAQSELVRVCLVQAVQPEELSRKLQIILDLKELPADASCARSTN